MDRVKYSYMLCHYCGEPIYELGPKLAYPEDRVLSEGGACKSCVQTISSAEKKKAFDFWRH
jgi:hypothetical protein